MKASADKIKIIIFFIWTPQHKKYENFDFIRRRLTEYPTLHGSYPVQTNKIKVVFRWILYTSTQQCYVLELHDKLASNKNNNLSNKKVKKK